MILLKPFALEELSRLVTSQLKGAGNFTSRLEPSTERSAGAATVVLFPVAAPALLVAGAAGGGAWIAHIAHGTSRGEAKDIGKMLNEGDSAVVIVGIDNDAEQVESAATRARDHVLKRNVGDWDDAEQDALEAVTQAEVVPA